MKTFKILVFTSVLCTLSLSVFSQEEDDWDAAFVPGVGYQYYSPAVSDTTGFFHGPTINFLLGSFMTEKESGMPSYLKCYLNFSLLKSSEKPTINLLNYSFGVSTSFENNISRKFLIPYFGLEIGGISSKELKNSLNFQPHLGILWYAKDNLQISSQGGYIITTNNYSAMKGVAGSITLHYALWKN